MENSYGSSAPLGIIGMQWSSHQPPPPSLRVICVDRQIRPRTQGTAVMQSAAIAHEEMHEEVEVVTAAPAQNMMTEPAHAAAAIDSNSSHASVPKSALGKCLGQSSAATTDSASASRKLGTVALAARTVVQATTWAVSRAAASANSSCQKPAVVASTSSFASSVAAFLPWRSHSLC
eukprot:6086254-Amphidinium_carterae.1